jgi:hypothetical protein
MFGVPGEGFHATRLGPIALYDTLGTVGIALLTSWLFKQSFWYHLLAWFVLGEVLHYAYGLNSGFLKLIGFSPQCP